MEHGAGSTAERDRRSALNAVKLAALVRDHLGHSGVPAAEPFSRGAALVLDERAWVLIDDRRGDRLGAALAWALRAGAGELNVLGDTATGALARRAAAFTMPIAVWHVEQRQLWPAVAEPLQPSLPAPEHHRRFVATIVAAGAEPVEEHGVLVGEVRGLEVCRVVDDPDTAETRLDVGVGAHDREAFAMLHGGEPTSEALQRVVTAVATHRRTGADPHPLNRIARERLMRSDVLDEPTLIGATVLRPAPPPVPRPNVKDPIPCVAVGTAPGGEPVVAVFSAGVDLELAPFAADARMAAAAADPGIAIDAWKLVVVTPERDRLPVTERLLGLLDHSVEVVSIG